MKALAGFIVFTLIAAAIWLAAAMINGKNEIKYECNVQQLTSGSFTKQIGRIYIGLDEFKWWARVFRWDKPFDVVTESRDFGLSNFNFAKYSNDKEIRLISNLAYEYSGTLSLLSGRLSLELNGNIIFDGTCKRIA